MIMDIKTRYEKRKKEVLKNSKNNKELFKQFFEWEERKLKRTNGLMEIDDRSHKTLILYVHYFKNVEKWFEGKDWKELTREDIQKVYDDLEDGKILNKFGKPLRDKLSYYNKVFKSKPFELAGKKELVKSIIEFTYKRGEMVRYLEEKDFIKIVDYGGLDRKKKLLFWLMWDLGENIGSILELRKDDFFEEENEEEEENGDKEYRVRLRKDILKRSRTSRTIIANHSETNELLEIVLPTLEERDKDNIRINENKEKLFNFGTRYVEMIMKDISTELNIKCSSDDGKDYLPTPKDLRSGMSCYLLKQGWTTDEIKNRLGHKPSSRVIDKYVSYFALDSKKPKIKLREQITNNLNKKMKNMERDFKQKEKLSSLRMFGLQNEIKNIKLILERITV